MKKLVLFSLIVAAASQATGCIISSGDDDGDVPRITSTWTIKSIDGTNLGCPAMYDTAALNSQEIDAAGNDVGPPIVDLFDCSAGIGTSAPLDATFYYSSVSIENTSGSLVYAESPSIFVDLVVENKQLDAKIYDDAGYFQLSWQLAKESNGSPLLCADVANIDGVETISTEVGNPANAASDIYDCTDHFGITAPLPAGNYTVHVDALNSSNQSIGDAPDLTNKTIRVQNQITNLGTITIPIAGL